jgi:general stress protein 26
MMSDNTTNGVQLLNEKIKGIRIAMLTTTEQDGTLHSRPMATQEMDSDGVLWFFTYADAPKVEDVEQQSHVNVSYSNPDDNLFVSVAGTAQLVRDRQKIKELWNPFVKAWFPNGQDDPNVGLLKVTVASAEYWDAPSGKMGALYTAVKNLATHGEKPAGENQKFDVN